MGLTEQTRRLCSLLSVLAAWSALFRVSKAKKYWSCRKYCLPWSISWLKSASALKPSLETRSKSQNRCQNIFFCTGSQAPAWEPSNCKFQLGLTPEAGASNGAFPSWSLGTSGKCRGTSFRQGLPESRSHGGQLVAEQVFDSGNFQPTVSPPCGLDA